MKTYIIIGSSAAGIGCASKLPQLDKDAKIICISDQKNLPYNKCLLADYISGTIPKEKLFFKDLSFFEKNNIQLLLETKVTKIEPENLVKLIMWKN
jgi:nitrite reductase (NADH) large subunit